MSTFNLNDFHTLQTTLEVALIPLVSKQVPRGFALATYLHRPATPTEQQGWFHTRDHYPAVGVVCGSPSNGLFVLDFDDLTMLPLLMHEFPFLKRTYTVQTRRGVHIYLRAPQPDVPSFSFVGGDLQGNGSYVVGAGSTVKGHCYTVSRDLPILTLNRHQWEGLLSVLHPHTPPTAVPSSPTPPTTQPRPRFTAQRPTIAPPATAQPPYQCLPIYFSTLDDGRNKALFKAACQGRDHGLTPEQVAEQLLSVFIHSPTPAAHRPQSLHQRRHEGLDTIASAFSHDARDGAAVLHSMAADFPANLRQAILQSQQVAVARVLDALLRHGIQPGDRFSRVQALTACQRFAVGTYSCNKALSASAPGMLRIFAEASGDFLKAQVMPTTQAPPAGVYEAKPKNNRGRPPRYYQMPTWEALETAYSLDGLRAGDPIPDEALRSRKRYRQATAEALFTRRPGAYSRQWLAQLLGTHISTISRYNRDWCEVDLLDDTPLALPISFSTLHVIPTEITERYHWLRREDGVCGLPRRGLAAYWLHLGHEVEYIHKRPHRYGRDVTWRATHVPAPQPLEPARSRPAATPAALPNPKPLWTSPPPDYPPTNLATATPPVPQPRVILPYILPPPPPAPYWRRVEQYGALIGFACPQHHLYVPVTGNRRPDADMRCPACAGKSLSGLRDARHERYRLERTVLFASGGGYQRWSDTPTPLIWGIASPFDTAGRAHLAGELEQATWQVELPPALAARYFDSEHAIFRWGLSKSLQRLSRLYYVEEGLPLFGREPLRLYFSMIQRHHLGIKQARTFLEGYVREYGQLSELEAALDSVDSQAFEGLGNIKHYAAYTVEALKRGLEEG
jgi:hypothetical protein